MWWDVLKEAKTPAAIEHKRKYETQYESTPARKKYRRELERERRKRGVAGKGGKDMSHTKTGKIVPEDPHTNRARSHPSVGSTLKMVIVKDYYFKEPESYDEDDNPMQTTRTGKTVPLARGIANPKMKPKYNLAHPKNVALGKEGADAFAQFIGPGIMHEETHRAMEPDIRAAMNELPDTMTDAEKRAWYMRAHEIGAYQGQFPGGQDAHEEAEATALGQRDSPRHPFIDESVTRFPKPIVKMVIVKAPMWDAQGNQVTGDVPKQMPDLADERQRQKKIERIAIGDTVTDSMAEAHQELLDLSQYPFGSQWVQQMNTDDPNRYLYQDKRLPVRAIVDVKDGVARIPTFATPLAVRGKGHGTEGLRNLKEELREMGINQMHPVDVMPSATGFWDKMQRRGITSPRPDVIKAPQMNLYGESAECASCKAAVDAQQAYATNRIFGETVCLACIQREQEKINERNDMMYHSEPTDRTQQMTLDGQIAPSTRTIIPVEDPAAVRQRIDTNTEKLRQRLEPRTNEQFAQDAEKAKKRRLKLHAMRAAGNTTLPHQ
tara:strand:- start:454 stop:2100 length:1647 start_codon:yes stop_codon:yes gene_type:complete